ncbi:helix-turn-helix domain-containing protein [bacterium]|nr:helix-turn-helix domain-containing protein [bacterium]
MAVYSEVSRSYPAPPRFEDFQPRRPHWQKLWALLDGDGRRARYEEAVRRLQVLERVRTEAGKSSERAALRAEGINRSTYRKWKTRFEAHGFEGLVNGRFPPRREEMPSEVQGAICTLRRADPDVAVETIVEHVKQHHGYLTSDTIVKRVLRRAGLNRRPGPPSEGARGEQLLELGGMKLVEAAAVETGYLAGLTKAVMEHARNAPHPETPPPVDTSGRDEEGRFLSEYNKRYRKGSDDAVGPGYASVEQKRAGLDPNRLHLMSARAPIIERKLLGLLVSPLLGSGRWDGIRVSRGELLGELCGYAYMPSTLDLFTRELKYLGVAPTLWEVHARTWLKQTQHWGGTNAQALLYIDGTTKGIWTQLFSQSTKVSDVGRVMPGLEVVAFHTGYGVPLWMVTHSGRAPLVKVVPELIGQLETTIEDAEVGRIVIIDAESNSIPFLKSLEFGTPTRAWVTRLKSSLVEGRRIFDRTNYRAYRNGDRVRMGLADFNDPDGDTFRMRVIEVERRSKGTITYLGASTLLDDREWKPQNLADAYFERWPNQEANFRAVNQAVGFKDVHGYGKQLVDNISVITEVERLRKRLETLEERGDKEAEALGADLEAVEGANLQLRRAERRMETVTHHLDERLAKGGAITPKLQQIRAEQRATAKKVDTHRAKVERHATAVEQHGDKLERIQAQTQVAREKLQEHEPRQQILQHDVELDSLFNVLKTGLVLLVTYVLKEYLGNARMDPVTFLERVATLPARLMQLPGLEILTFEYNRRDPAVMALITACSEAINARKLRMRSGRILRVQIDPAPKPRLPPPERRVRTKDRFAR